MSDAKKIELFVDGEPVKFIHWDMGHPEMQAMLGRMSARGWRNCRLEWYPEHPDGPGRFVIAAKDGPEDEKEGGSYNVSTFCPPVCP